MPFTSAHLKLALVGLTFSSFVITGCASSAPTAPAPKYGNGSTASVAPQAAPPNPNDMIVFKSSLKDTAPVAVAPAPQSAPAMSLSPMKSSAGDHLTPLH